MASETLAKLVVKMEADSARLQKDLDKANSRIDKFSKGAGTSLSSLGGAFVKLAASVAAIAGSAAFASFIKSSMEMIDANAKAADKLGIVSEKLQGMQYAASLAGIGSDDFNKSLQKMEKTVYDAQAGLSSAKDAIKQLGLNLNDLARMSPDKQFNLITDAISNLGSNTDKVGISMAIFGKSGADLLNVVGGAESTFKAATEEAIAFNFALNRVDAAKVEAANDAMSRVGAAARGVGNTIAVALSPYIAEIANLFADSARKTHGFQGAVDKALSFTAKAVGFVADMFRGLHAVWKGLEVAFFGLTTLIVRGLDRANTAIVNTLNLIPGLNVKPSEALAEWANSTSNSMTEAKNELMSLVTTPMPSKDIDEWFKRVRESAQKAAEEVAKTKTQLLAPPGESVAAVDTDKKERDKVANAMRDKVVALEKALDTEESAIERSYNDRIFTIEEALQELVINEKTAAELSTQVWAHYEAAKSKIVIAEIEKRQQAEFRESQDALRNTAATFGNLSAMSDANNRKAFNRSKQLARAQAAVDAIAAGIAAAKSAASLGPFAAFAAYAATYTGLALKIHQIESTHYEGGGSISGGGVSGGHAATTPNSTQSGVPISNDSNQRNPVVVQITVNGSVYPADLNQLIVGEVQRFVDNDGVLVQRNSATAREIMRA